MVNIGKHKENKFLLIKCGSGNNHCLPDECRETGNPCSKSMENKV